MSQSALRDAWRAARRDGELSPASQAGVSALKQQWESMYGDKMYGKLKWIQEAVVKQGGGAIQLHLLV